MTEAITVGEGRRHIAKLQQYTVELYRTIEERSGQNCSIHMPGGLMLAGDRERMDWLRMTQARGRYLALLRLGRSGLRRLHLAARQTRRVRVD